MQRSKTPKYRTVAITSKLWKEISKIVEVSGSYAGEAEFVREAVREKLRQITVSEVRDIREEELERLIKDYINKHGRAYPSDKAAGLGVPYFTVTNLISRLVVRGVLEQAIGESD